MTANFQRMEHRVDNDLQYICVSIRYLQTCVDEIYSMNAWHVPLSRGHSQPLPTSGLPFETWVPPPALSEAPAPPERYEQEASRKLVFSELYEATFRKIDLLLMTKGGRDSMELSGSYLRCFYLSFYLCTFYLWTCSI